MKPQAKNLAALMAVALLVGPTAHAGKSNSRKPASKASMTYGEAKQICQREFPRISRKELKKCIKSKRYPK